jgi:uncharacterized protein YbjT (DUF2867 family)
VSKQLPILILGGTGHYGRHIVRSLLSKDQPVRVLSRNAERARGVLGDRVEILQGDITSQASVVAALTDARTVVVAVSAFHPKLIRQTERIERDAVLAVWEEAQRAGVTRAVYLSVYDIRPDLVAEVGLESAKAKLVVEAALAGSSLNWTVLGASPSMQIFFSMIRGDTMMVPGGGPPALPTISPVDVGEIAAQTALRDDLEGQRIRLAGPEAVSFSEAAQRISAVIGREIRFQKIPLLPLRIASAVSRPVYPYLSQVAKSVALMNHFPPDVVAQAMADHQRLLETFDYVPTTLEMEARRWSKLIV